MTKHTSLPLPLRQTLERHAQRFEQVDVNAVSTFLTLLRTGNDLNAAFEANLARYGLTNGKFRLLVLLMEEVEYLENFPTPSQLALRAGLPKATVTGLLDSLEDLGLIARQDDPTDRRGLIIQLTETGQAALEKNLPDYFQRVSLLMSKLSYNEQDTLNKLLGKVREELGVLRDP